MVTHESSGRVRAAPEGHTVQNSAWDSGMELVLDSTSAAPDPETRVQIPLAVFSSGTLDKSLDLLELLPSARTTITVNTGRCPRHEGHSLHNGSWVLRSLASLSPDVQARVGLSVWQPYTRA